MLFLCCCICSIFVSWPISMTTKSWTKLLSISLPSSIRGHPGLVKRHSLGNPQWILSNRCLLTGLCNSDRSSAQATSAITTTSWQTKIHLNSLIVERTGFMHTESTRTTILAVLIYEYHFYWILSWMHIWLHRNFTIIAFWKQKSLWLIGLFTIIWLWCWWWSSYWTASYSSRW